MTTTTTQGIPFLLVPKSDHELSILKAYYSHLTEQVNQMELHISHKQDVQKVLTKSITVIMSHSGQFEKPQTKSAYARILKRLFG